MFKTMPITKARINLGAVVKDVSVSKKPVVLNRDGYPVAAIIDIDKLEDILDAADLAKERSTDNEFVEWDEVKNEYEL